MNKGNLPACYDCRIFFQPKGHPRTYIKALGKSKNDDGDLLECTLAVEEAKLFRPHVGWAGADLDWDAYHNAMKFLRTFFTMDNQYRPAKGSENFEDDIEHTKFVAETLDGKPRLTFVLIPLRS